MAIINGKDVQDMVRHWLATPVGGYLGSDYGSDIKSLLQLPQADGRADAFVAKLRRDIAAVYALPANSVNIYSVTSFPDRLDLVIEIAGQTITVPQG